MSLTPKQRELMLYLQRYIDANGGVSPSFDEMAEACMLASKSGIHRLLQGLEDRGHIARMHHRARAIRILSRVRDPNAPQLSDDGRDAFRALVRDLAHDREGRCAVQHYVKARQLMEQYP